MATRTVICVPKIDNCYSKNFIYQTFNSFNFGRIKKIDVIHLDKYQRAFIHYITWNNDERSKWVKNILDEGQDFKIIHDSPWYWKCSKSVSKSS